MYGKQYWKLEGTFKVHRIDLSYTQSYETENSHCVNIKTFVFYFSSISLAKYKLIYQYDDIFTYPSVYNTDILRVSRLTITINENWDDQLFYT